MSQYFNSYHLAVATHERDADLLQELYSAGLLVELLVNRELEAAGVSSEQFSFLGWVGTLQPVTPGELAAETGIPATTIRDNVRRLMARGLVRKRANPADGRSYHLFLSAQGTRTMERGWPAVVRAYELVAERLDPPAGDHIAALRRLRVALREALAAQPVPIRAAGRQRIR